MAALNSERNTAQLLGTARSEPMAAAVKVWKGGIVMRNADGYVTKGGVAVNCIGVGRAEETVDNSAGAAGAVSLQFRFGVFGFASAEGSDQITQTQVGKLCYILDDQTVAKTNGGGTRSPAGIVDGIQGDVVFVNLDEAVTRGAV